MKKVKFIKNGTRVGLAYSENETAELPAEMANELADAGIVKIIEETPAEMGEITEETPAEPKKTRSKK